jgi:hypothetical protein
METRLLGASAFIALSIATVVPGARAAPPPCPEFMELTLSQKISPGDRAARFRGGAVVRVRELRIDTDGAAVSYHPENIGTTHLCNGMNPFVEGRCLGVTKPELEECFAALRTVLDESWKREKSPPFCVYGFEVPSTTKVGDKLVWGGPFGSGPVQVQGPNDPAPGFFFSKTASPVPVEPGASLMTRYADADRIPYVVVPRSFIGATGPTEKRAAAALVRSGDLHAVPAIVGDVGRAPGEVSVAAAQLVQDPDLTAPVPITEEALRSKQDLPFPYLVRNGRVRAARNPSDGPYLVFVFSAKHGRVKKYVFDESQALSTATLSAFGGAEHLASCAKKYFEG